MNLEILRDYALSLKETTESLPFDNDTLVFKVMGKMFLLVSIENDPLSFNFKALPENGIQYREFYPVIKEGYHMSKVHWNTVQIDGSISETKLKHWILDSYDLVVLSLPKYKQQELKGNDA
jgi:predicted DNA-binding protein (MmcQ/YjbR family)